MGISPPPKSPPMRELIPPPEVFRAAKATVSCEGLGGALGHPRVWLQIGASGYADCGYCDRRFVLAGGAADRGDVSATPPTISMT